MTGKSSGEQAFIYALVDPREPEIVRYVGKAWNVEIRRRQHLSATHLAANTYKDRWIKKLLRAGVEPQVIIIECVLRAMWGDRERYWIAHYRRLGSRLTNSTRGGAGVCDPSNEVRKKMSRSHKGQIAHNKGKPTPKHIIEKLSKSHIGQAGYWTGRKLSTEHRRKLSEAHKKAWSDGKYNNKKRWHRISHSVGNAQQIAFPKEVFG